MSELLENYESYLALLNDIGVEPELTEEEFNSLSEEELAELSDIISEKMEHEDKYEMEDDKPKRKRKMKMKEEVEEIDESHRAKFRETNFSVPNRKPDHVVDIGKDYGPEAKLHIWHNSGPKGKHTIAYVHKQAHTGSEVYASNNPKVNPDRARKQWMGEEVDLDEGTAAANSLHPGAAPGEGMTKIGMMQNVLGKMNNMSKSDLTHWFDATMAQFGPGKTYGVGDNSAKNQGSIDTTLGSGPKTRDPMPRLNVKEDIIQLFDGRDELSEELKEDVSTLFEAAVNSRVILETAKLEEEYAEALNEEISVFAEEITAQLDEYLNYVVENWMDENSVAIESALRNQLADELLSGLKNLLDEHYIDVPEDKVDIIESMSEKIEELESTLNDVISENAQYRDVIIESNKQDVFDDIASDLPVTQQEKLAALAEGIEFDGDFDVYARKLLVIKENYFTKTNHNSNIQEESFEGNIVNEEVNMDPSVAKYVQSINRTVKH